MNALRERRLRLPQSEKRVSGENIPQREVPVPAKWWISWLGSITRSYVSLVKNIRENPREPVPDLWDGNVLSLSEELSGSTYFVRDRSNKKKLADYFVDFGT